MCSTSCATNSARRRPPGIATTACCEPSRQDGDRGRRVRVAADVVGVDQLDPDRQAREPLQALPLPAEGWRMAQEVIDEPLQLGVHHHAWPSRR